MQLARSEERLKIEIFSDHWTLEKEDKAMKTRSKNKVDPDPTQLHGFQGIIGSIFSRLEMRDLMNCRLVCRTFYNFLSVERSPWVDLLKNYVAQYSEVLETEQNGKEDEWRSKKRFSGDWEKFLALLYKDGELDDLMLVSHKFMKTLDEKKELIHLGISKVFCNDTVFESVGHFGDLRLFQLFNRLKFPYLNQHIHDFIAGVSTEFINQLNKEDFDTFIDCFKEMTIEQYENDDESPEVGYGWAAFEFCHALAIMMHTKDAYKVKRFLELKDMTDENCDDWDCNHKKNFPPFLRFAFEIKNLEIFKMVTNHCEIDFDEKISEVIYSYWFSEYDEKLRGFYPLHAAAKLSNYEIFEYVYSKATCKCPKMYTRDGETVLPYHLAGGKKFREKLEKFFYKEICSIKQEDPKRRLVPYVPPITSDEGSDWL